MGRPPGRIQSAPFQMRASPQFLKSVDRWRAKQEDKPSRAEAIRRLVELGLTLKSKPEKPATEPASRAKELAGKVIDKMSDDLATAVDQASRKRRLTKGPSEFRADRIDLPKSKK